MDALFRRAVIGVRSWSSGERGALLEALPVATVTAWVAVTEAGREWGDARLPSVRVLGHAGVALALLVAHSQGVAAGTATVASLSLTTALQMRLPDALRAVLGACALRALRPDTATREPQAAWRFAVVLLMMGGIALFASGDGDDDAGGDRTDAFALCGHVTLLAASATQPDAYARPLAALLVVAASWHARRPHLAWPLAVMGAASLPWSSVPPVRQRLLLGASPRADGLFVPERALWQTPRGPVRVAMVLIYAAALLGHAWAERLAEGGPSVDSDDDGRFASSLQAIHVGGIVAVCVFLYPQVHPRAHRSVRAIVCIAAAVDAAAAVAMLALLEGPPRPVALAVRGASAAGTAVALATLAPLAPLASSATGRPDEGSDRGPSGDVGSDVDCETGGHEGLGSGPTSARGRCARGRRIRWVGFGAVGLYVGHALSTLVLCDPPSDEAFARAFGRAVHLAFIVGGLGLEAQLHDDRLLLRLARTLAASDAIGTAADVALLYRDAGASQPANVLELVAHGALAATMAIALPVGRHRASGQLTFHAASTKCATVDT